MSACSSLTPKSEELREAPKCTVWKDGALGSKHITEVDGELAQQKMACWVMNTFMCSYTDYTFKENSSEIKSSLPPADKTIATLDGNRMTVNMRGLTVEPFVIGKQSAVYNFEGPIGGRQVSTVEFSKSCTTRQAALGLLVLIGK